MKKYKINKTTLRWYLDEDSVTFFKPNPYNVILFVFPISEISIKDYLKSGTGTIISKYKQNKTQDKTEKQQKDKKQTTFTVMHCTYVDL